ncbi:MAG TPA: OB-fold domain-containing protein [Pseudolysinimonas sp.]|jgi:hypothetical protein
MMATNEYTKPIPNLDDPDMKPFWAATREHRLTAQRCTHCGILRFPALPICDRCLDEGMEWVDVSTRGIVWSYVVYHRAFHPGFADQIPYVTAIVENEDGVRYTGRVLTPAAAVDVGTEVEAVFEDATAEFTMVHWVPRAS